MMMKKLLVATALALAFSGAQAAVSYDFRIGVDPASLDLGVGGANPNADGNFQTLNWIDNDGGILPDSFLFFSGSAGNVPHDVLTKVGEVGHQNNVIQQAFNHDFILEVILDIGGKANAIVLALQEFFVESTNLVDPNDCPGLNPLGSACDDRFTSVAPAVAVNQLIDTPEGLLSVDLQAFNFQGFVEAGGDLWTAEDNFNTLDIGLTVTKAQVPEPTPLALIGLGLLMTGLVTGRKTDWRKHRKEES